MLHHDPLTSPGLRPVRATPHSPFSAALLEHAERRRVPEADGLNPDARPPHAIAVARPAAKLRLPLQLLWHLREVQASGTGNYRISVPLSGSTPAPDAGVQLQRILEQMWVHYPTSELSAADSVSVVIGSGIDDFDEVDRHRLVIVLTVDRANRGRRIDGTQMARHLRTALDQLTYP